MKPTFALDLTSERIALLHRAGRGWVEVGAVSFGSDALEADMAVLRATAAEMSPKGITTKLILPDSQILYTRVPVAGTTDAARRAEVAAALDGMTPYAVADLAFDVVAGEDGMADVAAVARETLAEAEGFAVAHRLNPVAVVGEAAAGWASEPFFGPTAAAAEILGKGAKVSRDTQPVLIRQAQPPEVMAEELAPPIEPIADTTVADAPPAEVPATDPTPEAVSADVPGPEAAATASPAEETAPAPDPAPVVTFPPAAPAPEVTADVAPATPQADPDEAPFTHVADSTVPDLPPAAENDDLPPAPAPAMMVAFSSRRATAAPKAPPPPGTVAERLAQRAAALSQTARSGPPGPQRNFGAFEPAATRRRPGEGGIVPPPPRAEAAPAGDGQTQPGLVTTTIPPTSAPPPPRLTPSTPRKALTKPGGTFAQAAPARGRPRFLGLILTGVLLAFLALVAAWASFFLEARDDTSGVSEPAVAAAPAEPAAPAPEIAAADAAAAPETETQASEAPFPPVETATAVVEPAAPPATPEAPAAEPTASVTEPPPAEEEVAAPAPPEPAGPPPEAGEAQAAALPAPDDAGADQIIISGADTAPLAPPAPSLAAATIATDALPAAQMPPPAFGTVYQFDSNGWIQPTAEGIVTPDGVRLVAGAPPLAPPERPSAITAAAAEAAASASVVPGPAATPATTPFVDPVTTVGADPALQGFRPLPRPAGLAPATAGSPDDAALPADTAARFASLPRPPARPAALAAAAAAEADRLAAAAAAEEEARRNAASLAAQAAAESAVAAVVADDVALVSGDGSRMAVAVSRVPAPRPRSLERAVAAAVQAATRDPQPAEVTPEAEDEPEVASAAPSTPTRANVAEQATFANAISLREMNLIGVYGSEANRRALVRQANGRYRQVEVGDRLDGGTVAAITDDEVRYQKGGRLYALQMPEG